MKQIYSENYSKEKEDCPEDSPQPKYNQVNAELAALAHYLQLYLWTEANAACKKLARLDHIT